MTEIKAQCPCGRFVTVQEPQDGQCLYGTLAWKMLKHEPCPALNRAGNRWNIIHGENEATDEMRW